MQFADLAASELHDGTYYPNEPGATSLRDARPLFVDGQEVSAVVSNAGQATTIFVGSNLVFEGSTPVGVSTQAGLLSWVANHPALVRAPKTIYLPPTPVWDTLAPKAKNRNHGKGQAGITNRKRRRK